jgi:signal peptidase I
MSAARAISAAVVVCAALFTACGDDEGAASNDTTPTELVRIPSASMAPTFTKGDVVTLNHAAYDDARPMVGDVIVFHPPASATPFGGARCALQPSRGAVCMAPAKRPASEEFIKRVVALPGDDVGLAAGRTVVNGELAVEPFIRPCQRVRTCDYPRAASVPNGHYFVLGDNRGVSEDSRFWGPIPLRWIEGRIGD